MSISRHRLFEFPVLRSSEASRWLPHLLALLTRFTAFNPALAAAHGPTNENGLRRTSVGRAASSLGDLDHPSPWRIGNSLGSEDPLIQLDRNTQRTDTTTGRPQAEPSPWINPPAAPLSGRASNGGSLALEEVAHEDPDADPNED